VFRGVLWILGDYVESVANSVSVDGELGALDPLKDDLCEEGSMGGGGNMEEGVLTTDIACVSGA
jgi:hypothetical protein